MKRITRELIEGHFGKQKRIRHWWCGSWFVDLESGASVKITRKRLDFGKYRDPKNRKDISEALFQCEVRDSLALANEIWGGISLYGAGDRKEFAAVLEYAAAEGFETGDQGCILRHFGPDATIKYGWHSFTVTVPNRGYVKVDCGAIEKVCGDLLRPALAMAHEMVPDKIVVRGKAELLVMAIHEARAMGITVIPESDMEMFIAVTANVAVVVCGVVAFQWLDVWPALLVGYIGGGSLCSLAFHLFETQLRNRARRKGLEIVGFETATVNRKSSIDEARKAGMI